MSLLGLEDCHRSPMRTYLLEGRVVLPLLLLSQLETLLPPTLLGAAIDIVEEVLVAFGVWNLSIIENSL